MRMPSRVILVALFLGFAGVGEAEAQANWWWGATYQGALGAGDTKELVEAFSWRNFGVDGRLMVKKNTSVGLYAGWNVFHDQGEGMISLGGADLSGMQHRYVNAVPLLLTAHLYTGTVGGRGGFLGIGAGAYWVENRLEVGMSSLSSTNWHAGIAPEVGIFLPIEGSLDGYLSVKYNYAFENGGIQPAYWTFGIGVGRRSR
jgi:hypothetical protein